MKQKIKDTFHGLEDRLQNTRYAAVGIALPVLLAGTLLSTAIGNDDVVAGGDDNSGQAGKVVSTIKLNDPECIDDLLGMQYDAISMQDSIMTPLQLLKETGRRITNSIPVRNHYFDLDGKRLTLEMSDVDYRDHRNFTDGQYVARMTLENVVFDRSLYGIDTRELDKDSPSFSQSTYNLVKNTVLTSSDWDVLLPYYNMSFEELDNRGIKFYNTSFPIDKYDGLDVTTGRLNFVRYATIKAKNIARKDQSQDFRDRKGVIPKAYFLIPTGFNYDTLSVDMTVGVIDLNPQLVVPPFYSSE